ncbi:MAG: Tim44/TimA family putative adaptor protein [Alphaproteobacteria bacterium]
MTAELMLYALIAAGLIFWLRNILGTRDESEGEGNVLHLELNADGKIVGVGDESADGVSDKSTLIEELAQNSKGSMSIADKTAENNLLEIVGKDKDFDIYIFLQAAQDAFVYIVESFAEGDRETLEDLLSPEVFNAFDGAITAREKAGETMITEIHSIKRSEVVEARLDGKTALVTVRFWADETSVTKDAEENILHGHPEKTTQMRDVWTFARDLKSRDPRWLVVETREDGEGDNEVIPNTH